jgi:hypothetical protein
VRAAGEVKPVELSGRDVLPVEAGVHRIPERVLGEFAVEIDERGEHDNGLGVTHRCMAGQVPCWSVEERWDMAPEDEFQEKR